MAVKKSSKTTADKKSTAKKTVAKPASKTAPKKAEIKKPAPEKKSAAPKAATAKKAAIPAKKPVPEKKPAAKPAKVAKKSKNPEAEHKQKLNDKIRQLIHLSKEKGYLTNQDIDKYLTETLSNPNEFDNVVNILENLEVEILDNEEDIENYKTRKEESEERQSRALQTDTLDDPVRMYLKQMGQVPLLTREEEVAIASLRLEGLSLRQIAERLGLTYKQVRRRYERYKSLFLEKKG